jgi:hypothetical protein
MYSCRPKWSVIRFTNSEYLAGRTNFTILFIDMQTLQMNWSTRWPWASEQRTTVSRSREMFQHNTTQSQRLMHHVFTSDMYTVASHVQWVHTAMNCHVGVITWWRLTQIWQIKHSKRWWDFSIKYHQNRKTTTKPYHFAQHFAQWCRVVIKKINTWVYYWFLAQNGGWSSQKLKTALLWHFKDIRMLSYITHVVLIPVCIKEAAQGTKNLSPISSGDLCYRWQLNDMLCWKLQTDESLDLIFLNYTGALCTHIQSAVALVNLFISLRWKIFLYCHSYSSYSHFFSFIVTRQVDFFTLQILSSSKNMTCFEA